MIIKHDFQAVHSLIKLQPFKSFESIRYIRDGICGVLKNTNLIYFIKYSETVSQDDYIKFFPSETERILDFYPIFNGKSLLTVHSIDETMKLRIWDISNLQKPELSHECNFTTLPLAYFLNDNYFSVLQRAGNCLLVQSIFLAEQTNPMFKNYEILGQFNLNSKFKFVT